MLASESVPVSKRERTGTTSRMSIASDEVSTNERYRPLHLSSGRTPTFARMSESDPSTLGGRRECVNEFVLAKMQDKVGLPIERGGYQSPIMIIVRVGSRTQEYTPMGTR